MVGHIVKDACQTVVTNNALEPESLQVGTLVMHKAFQLKDMHTAIDTSVPGAIT